MSGYTPKILVLPVLSKKSFFSDLYGSGKTTDEKDIAYNKYIQKRVEESLNSRWDFVEVVYPQEGGTSTSDYLGVDDDGNIVAVNSKEMDDDSPVA